MHIFGWVLCSSQTMPHSPAFVYPHKAKTGIEACRTMQITKHVCERSWNSAIGIALCFLVYVLRLLDYEYHFSPISICQKVLKSEIHTGTKCMSMYYAVIWMSFSTYLASMRTNRLDSGYGFRGQLSHWWWLECSVQWERQGEHDMRIYLSSLFSWLAPVPTNHEQNVSLQQFAKLKMRAVMFFGQNQMTIMSGLNSLRCLS